MKLYSIVPNIEGTSWMIKSEDEVHETEYQSKDDAIIKAEEIAAKNSPSRVEILDGNNRIVHERKF